MGLKVVDCPLGNDYKVSVTGLAFVSLWLPCHFERWYEPVWFHRFIEPVKGSREISRRMLPCGSQFRMEFHFAACPRTPFPAARAFPSRENKT